MSKLKSTLLNMLLSLTGICIVAAFVLSFVQKQTSVVIEEAKVHNLEAALAEVTPPFDNQPLSEMITVTVGNDPIKVYPARKEGKLVGMGIESISHNGFGGDVVVLVGLDTDARIVDYSVLQMTETPGLGDKMTAWFRDEARPGQNIKGRSLADGPLTVSKDGGQVDAISAATISSRAFLEAVNTAKAAYDQAIGQLR